VIPCGDLAAVDNAKFTITGYMPRDNITYTCLEGYEHSEGTMTRECNLGGNICLYTEVPSEMEIY
jgi:hypothetical protein